MLFKQQATSKEKPDERIFGTAATVALCAAAGVSIMRVHDIAEMLDALKMNCRRAWRNVKDSNKIQNIISCENWVAAQKQRNVETVA